MLRAMARGVALYLVGSVALVALAACGRSWFEEREPWRHEAEAECIKSGSVKEGPAIVQMRPIQGPGMCGADFPLKVSALGDSPPLAFADDPRPPGMIPQSSIPQSWRAPPAEPLYAPPQAYPARPPYAPVAAQPGAPLTITPPGSEPYGPDEPGTYADAPYPERYRAPRASYPSGPVEPEETAPPPSRSLSIGGSAAVTPAATLACPLVSSLDNWMSTGVQPAAQRWFGQPVVEIRQISAYACRSMNGQRGAPISEHAFGNALDIAAFTLADGRKVTVREGWRGLPEERGFLHDVHASACRQFSTVLAPGSNAFHYDHIHVDLARRASGRSICNPAPIPGDAVARRDPFVTGSTGPRPAPRLGGYVRGRAYDASLPSAVAGED